MIKPDETLRHRFGVTLNQIRSAYFGSGLLYRVMPAVSRRRTTQNSAYRFFYSLGGAKALNSLDGVLRT